MTGEKNRFKTHEKLWNIDDKSLKTPKHDAMVLWLMDEDNLNKLDFPKFPTNNKYEEPSIAWLKEHSEHADELEKLEEWYDIYNTYEAPYIPGKLYDWEIREKYGLDDKDNDKLEKARETEKSDFIQTLYDELSTLCHGEDIFGTKVWEEKADYRWDISTEVPLKSSPTFIAGYADLIVSKEWHDDLTITFEKQMYDLGYFYEKILSEYSVTPSRKLWTAKKKEISSVVHTTVYLIEVKPYIDSFGAVMRQLNSYKTFSRVHVICLFTLDTRFDKQFESQGVTVLHPPEDVDMEKYAKEMGF